jgi:gliding motility-associated-like protein
MKKTLVILTFLLSQMAYAQLVVDDNVTDSILVNTMVGGGVTFSNVSLNCNQGAYGVFNSTNSNVGLSEGILLSTGKVAPVDDCIYTLNLSDANFNQWDCGSVNVYVGGVLVGNYTIAPTDFGWFSTQIYVPVGSSIDIEYLTTGGGACDELEHELSLTDPGGVAVLNYNGFGGIPTGIIYNAVANCNPAVLPFPSFSAVGPNNSNRASYDYNTVFNDADLMALDNLATNDVCILEFDFIPLGNQVDFQYVFASEEYPNFVCSINDIFGFFISGPGITGTQNIALVPGTTTPVSINTVNDGLATGTGCPPGGLMNAQYYISNGDGGDCWTAPAPAHCTDSTLIRYNGLTVPLTASSVVVACQTYHLKMAIADGVDGVFDSGVFLAANSLTSNQIGLGSNFNTTSGDSIIYENCGATSLAFTRTDTLGSTTVHFTIGGSAINGVDYPTIADSIVFSPGQDTVYLVISANADGVTEAIEVVTIQLIQTICAVIDTTTVQFYISDLAPITTSTNDASISCGTDSVKIGVGYIGPVDSIIWNTGAIGDSIWVSPIGADYYVTLTDTCGGAPALDTVTVTVLPGLPISITYMHDSSVVCGASQVPIWVNYTGPVDSVTWSTGAQTDTIWVNPLTTTTYYVAIKDSCGQYLVNDSSLVTVLPSAAITLVTLNDTSKYCIQDSMRVYATPFAGVAGFTFSWSPGGATDSSIDVSPATTTTYYVDVLDICGTTARDSVTITVPNYIPLSNTVTTNDVIICPGDPVVLNATITGGVGTYYSWDNGVGDVIPSNVNPTVTTNYILSAADSCGALVLDSVLVTMNPFNYQSNLPDSISMSCLNETILLDPALTGGDGAETYLWNTTDVTSTIQVTNLLTTIYTVEVSDICSSIFDTIKVVAPVFTPLGVSVNADLTVNCPGDPVILIATFSGGSGQTLVVNWTDGTSSFTGNNITVNPTVNTTYTAFVKDACANDSATASFLLTVPIYLPLQIVMSDDTLVCVGGQANLTATGLGGHLPYTYSWSDGATSAFIQVLPPADMNYNVTITDVCGSQIGASVSVSVESPTAYFSHEYIDQFSIQFTDSSFYNIVSHWWTFEEKSATEANPINTFGGDGLHDVWLKVEDANGCFDSIVKTIKPPHFVYAPNSFSPNGDGINDEFNFKGMGIKSFRLLIYNRLGELIFQTENMNNGWNGDFKGVKVPTGVYVYKVYVKSYENIIYESAGDINLIK